MKSSKKEIFINHSASQLYEIVLDIEKYPEFIPWCNNIIIKSQKKNQIIADMIVKYKFLFSQTFSSHVSYDSSKLKINTTYVKGPLKDLKTQWQFIKIKNKETKVIFNITFEFEKNFHQKIAELFFNLIENEMINSFKKRADDILN